MSKLRESARGRECQVRMPGACDFNPETTVLAHLNIGGMRQKAPDIHGAFACFSCHDIVDGRKEWKEPSKWYGDDYDDIERKISLMFHEAVIRTQEIWIKEGLISF